MLSLKRDGWRPSRKIWRFLLSVVFFVTLELEPNPQGQLPAPPRQLSRLSYPTSHGNTSCSLLRLSTPKCCPPFLHGLPAHPACPSHTTSPSWPRWQSENGIWESVGYCKVSTAVREGNRSVAGQLEPTVLQSALTSENG